MEPDTHAVLGDQENVLLVVRCLDLDQLVVLPQHNGLQAVLAHVLVLAHGRFLHHAALGGHKQVFVLIVLPHGNDRRDLLLRLKLEQVHDGRSPGRTARLGNLVCLQAVNPSRVGKAHHIVVVGGHQKVLNVVLLDGLHPLDALSAAVLGPEIVHVHALDVT